MPAISKEEMLKKAENALRKAEEESQTQETLLIQLGNDLTGWYKGLLVARL